MADRLASIVARRPNSEDRGLLLNVIRGAGLYRHDLVNCLQPTDQIWRQLKRISPTVLGGFPSAVARLVQDGRDVSCADVRPRFVAVGVDTLTPLMRQQIADAFGVRVFEMYNSVECGTLAWQCRDTSALHTCDDALIIEVLRNGVPVGDDERGEVVVTNLHTFAMPLIRLRLGDIVVKGSSACDCGAPFGTIRSIEGRMMDYFPLPSGRIIHPYSIVPQLGRAGVPWMRAYRLLQERRDRFVLTLVAGTAPSDAQLAMIRRTIVEGIGEPVQVDVQLVDHLELERNGKFRVARSLVTSMYDEVPTLPPVEAAEAPMLIDAGPR
jgi:phenylacetate-CoA ligase